jgi:hypothetical protein
MKLIIIIIIIIIIITLILLQVGAVVGFGKKIVLLPDRALISLTAKSCHHSAVFI